MATEKQIMANRKNASKSTGPKTDVGKSASKKNSVKHGLLSIDPLTHPGEKNVEEFQKYTSSMTKFLNPQNDMEMFFVNRIISCTWRLKRVTNIEEAIFNASLQNQDGDDPATFLFEYLRDKMNVISRYETAIERSLFKTLNELRKVKGGLANGVFT